MTGKNDKGNITKYESDLIGRVIKETNGNLVINYEYDANDNLIKESDNTGAVYSYEYNMLGGKTKETDANGNETEYIYDSLNRLIQKNIPFDKETGEKSVVKYKYDNNGNITEERIKTKNSAGGDTERITKREYNKRNRVVKETQAGNDEKEEYTLYEYDKVGNLTKVKGCSRQWV